MEIEVLHAARGDKRKQIDTSTEKGRQEAAVFLNKLMRQGTAIFLERGKKTLRVKGYDPAKDMLIVTAEVKGKDKDVRTRGRKGKAVAIAPVAGGMEEGPYEPCPICFSTFHSVLDCPFRERGGR